MQRIHRRQFLKLAGAATLSMSTGPFIQCTSMKSPKPNIIYINVDDLGWKDVGYMGSKFYETPNIDRLARQGVYFTNAYAPAANCAPSRACCLTGQYTPRHGIYTVNSSERGDSRTRKLIPVQNNTVLSDHHLTLAESLRQNGYSTAHIGKWHLGQNPRTQGFDINIAGSLYGHPSSYFSPYKNDYIEDGPDGEYLPDRLTSEAIRFISDNRDEPFFLHLAYYSVHTPIQPKPEKIDHYRRKNRSSGQDNPRYAAMVESVDENIGHLLDKLDELHLTENTVVLFTSDNGGVRRITSMAPLRAGKGSYYEGGIREPLIIRWPLKIKRELTCDVPVSGIDFFPTILAMSGTRKPENTVLDGVTILPLLLGKTIPQRALYWHFPIYLERGNRETRDPIFRTRPGSVIRYGDWKLHEYFEDGDIELYNLRDDIGEKNNIAGKYKDITDELYHLLDSWRQSIHAPIPTKCNPEYNEEFENKLLEQKLKG